MFNCKMVDFLLYTETCARQFSTPTTASVEKQQHLHISDATFQIPQMNFKTNVPMLPKCCTESLQHQNVNLKLLSTSNLPSSLSCFLEWFQWAQLVSNKSHGS